MSHKKKKPPDKIMAFRLDDETHRRLAQLAKSHGVKPTTVAREMVQRSALSLEANPIATQVATIHDELMEIDSAVMVIGGTVEEHRAAFDARMDRIEALIRLLLTIDSRAAAVTWNTARRNDQPLYDRSMKEADAALQKKINELLPPPKPNGA